MIVPDVNLLLYATITGFPHHQRARQWWEQCINGTDRVGLASPAVFGFLRIATSARILESPMALGEAIEHIRQWVAQPNVTFLVPGPDHLDVALGLLESAGTAANLTTDAQLAAFALENGGEVHSNDTDFGRFQHVSWVDPLRMG